ncbi:MAG: hypothetical protein H8E26_07555 [FCB group bacterium]|nr:hypothetical protein [FCB group bacterium]MBL7120357.1 hypothetical protein [Candidatus Neomarinimicrobiota bacterium]
MMLSVTRKSILVFFMMAILVRPITGQHFQYSSAGTFNNVTLGALNHPEIVNELYTNWINYDIDLSTELYDIHIPQGYDESEPFGLIIWINSNSGGKPKTVWRPVLEDYKLIWIGGQDVGNGEWVSNRLGRSLLATYKGLELFNIDTNRIYLSGSSGGMRSATALQFGHPELYKGVAGRVGSAFPEHLPQVYETRDPNSHYETSYFLGQGVNDAEFRDRPKALGRRFAIITSFNDFREGDNFNVYHFGFERYGFLSRIIDQPGRHSNSWNEHSFRDAINFLDHPLDQHTFDEFGDGSFNYNPGPGNGFINLSTVDSIVMEANGQLVLSPTAFHTAALQLTDEFYFMNPSGASIEMDMIVERTLEGNLNSSCELGVWNQDFGPEDDLPQTSFGADNRSGFLVSLNHSNTQQSVSVYLINPNHSDPSLHSMSIFEGNFGDWPGDDPGDMTNAVENPLIDTSRIGIKMILWQDEINVTFARHIQSENLLTDYVALCDDERTIRIRFDGDSAWYSDPDRQHLIVQSDWTTPTHAYLTIASTALDSTQSASPLVFDNLEVIHNAHELYFDLDGNGVLDVSDLLLLVEYIIYPEFFPETTILSGDINQDLATNILDVVQVVSMFNFY